MAFSQDEQTRYWKRKWLHEHRVLIAALCTLYALALIIGFFQGVAWVFGASSLVGVIVLLILRNRMLLYIDHHTKA